MKIIKAPAVVPIPATVTEMAVTEMATDMAMVWALETEMVPVPETVTVPISIPETVTVTVSDTEMVLVPETETVPETAPATVGNGKSRFMKNDRKMLRTEKHEETMLKIATASLGQLEK